MSQNKQIETKWALASVDLQDAYTDFILSRQAMLCSPSTVNWYKWTLGKVMEWLENNGVTQSEEITSRHVRAYLSGLAERGLKDSYIHCHARAIRTLLRFFDAEDYLHKPVTFQMPVIADKRHPVLTAVEVAKVLQACNEMRDKAMVMLMVDTGVRRAELVLLVWDDLDIGSGLVRIARGKGLSDATRFDRPSERSVGLYSPVCGKI